MRVLIAASDILSVTGGGQSFYSALVRRSPNHHFTYLGTMEGEAKKASPNATVAPLVDTYRRLNGKLDLSGLDLEFDGYTLLPAFDALLYCMDLASSVAGQSFDVVDIPDFFAYGALLPAALRFVGVKFDKVALSMHGTISDALTDNWGKGAGLDLSLASYFDDLLYRSADIRYAISKPYLDQWVRTSSLKAMHLDLSTLIDFARFARIRKRADAQDRPNRVPDVAFIGRQEKWKGPDLFIDIVAGVPVETYGAARLVGPSVTVSGHSSSALLEEMASRRRIDIQQTTEPQETLWRDHAEGRWVVVIPSRKDTFNLAALEAVLCGAPTMISGHAGVCEFLEQVFPGIPFVKFDVGEIAKCRQQLEQLLGDFPTVRARLRSYLATAKPKPRGASIDEVYDTSPERDSDAHATVEAMFGRLARDVEREASAQIRTGIRDHLSQRWNDFVSPNPGDLRTWGMTVLDHSFAFLDLEQALKCEDGTLPILQDYEYTEVTNRMAPACFSGNRAPIYSLLADLEERRGNALLYATYVIRAARLSASADPGRLAKALGILRESGFDEEASVAKMLYSRHFDLPAASEYLDNMARRFHQPPPQDFTTVLDRRKSLEPKISIIVSLYNAADKIPKFIRGLQSLTEASLNRIELIFVDSNSPDNTSEVMRSEIEGQRRKPPLGISTIYVKTTHRETIQKAWNRGIALARGAYLAFLGVDEMNRPDTFDLLGDFLDRNPGIDWVQGTAVVTEVDKAGAFVSDVMAYDRMFENANVQYLDTCFIGYVGALYRKDIHRRVGLYDERFRAAGDTEFKNRAWPKMAAATIPHCLGYFWNYPEERTTHSPTAELEDIRAWHLHRSLAGMAYAFDGTPADDAADLFFKCLSHRKSYMSRTCTDLDLAATIAEYLRYRSGEPYRRIAPYVPYVLGMRESLRTLDNLTDITRQIAATRRISETAGALESSISMIDRSLGALSVMPRPVALAFHGDNRFHQHQLIWPSRLTRTAIGPKQLAEAGPELKESLGENLAAADEARDAQRWAVAAIFYKAVLDEDPSLAPIWVQYGHSVKESGDRLSAEEAYRAALKIEPGNADTHLQLGHLMKLLGRRDAAHEAYLAALRNDPGTRDARVELVALGMTHNQITAAVRQKVAA